MAVLKCELETWCDERKQLRLAVNWQFTTQDARIKLSLPYPKLM